MMQNLYIRGYIPVLHHSQKLDWMETLGIIRPALGGTSHLGMDPNFLAESHFLIEVWKVLCDASPAQWIEGFPSPLGCPF